MNPTARPDPVLQLLAFAGVGLPASATRAVAPASVTLAARVTRPRGPSRPAPVSVLEAHAKIAVAA